MSSPFSTVFAVCFQLTDLALASLSRLHISTGHRRPPNMGIGFCAFGPKRRSKGGANAHNGTRDRDLSTGFYGAISVALKSLTLVRVGPVIRLSPILSNRAWASLSS